MKIRAPMMTAPMAEMSTMPEATSLAILASKRCSLVIRSTIRSIELLIISEEMTKSIVSANSPISKDEILRIIPAMIAMKAAIK